MPNVPGLSTSLPSSFRFRPLSFPHSSFFNPYPEEDDPSRCLAPSVDSTSARTRLEVLKGWEVSFSVLSLYFASALACLYVLFTTCAATNSWLTSHATLPSSSFDRFIRIALETASVALPVYYFLNLVLIPRLTHEQIWTSVLLTVGLLATNPLTRDDLTLVKPRYLVITDSIYTATIYLYLLLVVHSYRVLDNQHIHSLLFYLPKLIIALSYALFKLIAGLSANISLGLIPFARVVTWIRLLCSHRSSLNVTTSVLLTTCMDLAFAIYLVGQVSRTADFLGTVPYVENRAKQLGFRCFVYQTLAFCVSIITLSIVTTLLLPSSYLIYLTHNSKHITVLEPPVARLALAFIYFTWTLVLAYVNLPPTPLLHRALYNLLSAFLHQIRNSPVTLWLGLADVVDTADAEDSADEVEAPAHQSTPPNHRSHTVAYAANPLQPPLIPMRYRHHELFDIVPLTSSTSSLHSTFSASGTITRINPIVPPYNRAPSNSTQTPLSKCRTRSFPSHHDADISVNHSTTCRRLRLRKNLFVMETQVLMVNVAYLAYIFGNPREELPTPSSSRRDEHSKVDIGLPFHVDEPEPPSTLWSASLLDSSRFEESQPELDDGTMFRVDPYTLAERYGYKVHKYVACASLNTHAIVLVNSTRVIVSFSGTRDMSNWKVNANVNRVVLDDRLTRFEYDVTDTLSLNDNVIDTDTPFDALLHSDGQFGVMFDPDHSGSFPTHGVNLIRRSKSASECDFPTQSLTEEDRTLLFDTRIRSYGTLRTSTTRRALSFYSSRDRPHASAHGPSGFTGLHNHASRVKQRVSIIASTFAHELATFGKAKVHAGFLEAYMSVRKRVLGALVELYGGRDGKGSAASLPLFFTGHSLGGAMATFGCYEAARYFKRIGIARRQDISCTTFGCPRVGNEAFKMRYERLVETHWRFEMAADPIPYMPTLVLNYVPVGVQVLIDQSGMLLIDPSFIEVQWWGRLANPYLGYKLHIRASYCMALRTYCKLYKNGMDDLADRFWPFPLRIQTKGFFRQLQFESPTTDNSEQSVP